MPPWMGGCLVWVLEKICAWCTAVIPWLCQWSWKREFKCCSKDFLSFPYIERSVEAHCVVAVEEWLLG